MQEDRLSNRLNAPVTHFKGCTFSEIFKVAGFSVVVCEVVFITLFSFFDNPMFGFTAGMVAAVPVAILILIWLGRMKLGKPNGYYDHWLAVKLCKLGLRKNQFVTRSGAWSVGRKL